MHLIRNYQTGHNLATRQLWPAYQLCLLCLLMNPEDTMVKQIIMMRCRTFNRNLDFATPKTNFLIHRQVVNGDVQITIHKTFLTVWCWSRPVVIIIKAIFLLMNFWRLYCTCKFTLANWCPNTYCCQPFTTV